MLGSGVEYSHAELGQEPGPELDWVDYNDLSPEDLSQLHGRHQRVKHPSEFELRCQHLLDADLLLSDAEFEKRYF